MKRNKQTVCSPIASVVREAAASGNQFAQYLIQSHDYFFNKSWLAYLKDTIESTEQKLIYTKHSKQRRRLKNRLERLKYIQAIEEGRETE